MLSIKDWRVLGPKEDELTPPAEAQGSNRQTDWVVDSFSKTVFPRQNRAGAHLCGVTVLASDPHKLTPDSLSVTLAKSAVRSHHQLRNY